MNITKIKSNLTKIDATPNGIFYLSYNTPIVYVKGHKVLENRERYSVSSTSHLRHLRDKDVLLFAELADAEVLGKLAIKAGIQCDW